MAAWNVNVNYNSQTKGMSDLALANVEALAQESGDCHNVNGYRQFYKEKGAGAYDCCYVWRDGVGENDCQ